MVQPARIVQTVDEALRLLDHLWGRIECTKSRGATLTQDVGRRVGGVKVHKHLLAELLRAKFIQTSSSQCYFARREMFEISELGLSRVRGTSKLRSIKRHE